MGSTKEAQGDKVLIKSHQFGVRALNGCVRALKAHGLRLLTLHMEKYLCFVLMECDKV